MRHAARIKESRHTQVPQVDGLQGLGFSAFVLDDSDSSTPKGVTLDMNFGGAEDGAGDELDDLQP